jgi:predicted component of type VI protein secretion system
MVAGNVERRIEGVLIRIREKLDSHDSVIMASPEETVRSVGKMINSLDKLIYDPNYYGKNIPEIRQIVEVKKMLKDVDHPRHDIEHIKRAIDVMLYTKKERLRRALGE